MSTPTMGSNQIVSKPPPWHLRAAYHIGVWSFKAAFRVILSTRRLTSGPGDLLRPEIKKYDFCPELRNRVFRPQNSDGKLPLYLDVHGGGWAAADPETDDEFCSFMASNFNIIVVSVDYRKSPTNKFPVAVGDVAAAVEEVINDESLNIDKNKVALGGFSAGGNLAFAAAQMVNLRGRLSALVGFYPVLDLSESADVKLGRCPPNAPSDVLKSSANLLGWAYVPKDVDRQNPLLSPLRAEPNDLPAHVYLVGAEYDMLCYEAHKMAEVMAKHSAPDCERTSISTPANGAGWQQGGVRWECAMGKQHAFTHIEKHGQKEEDRVQFCHEMYHRIGSWLTEEVWATPSVPDDSAS
ncbi:MAG: hypothetical protein M1840_000960 [Geoglossum simile]|nr:MAG: hypothetical protein M1840_000960 [Geoglossum simile]